MGDGVERLDEVAAVAQVLPLHDGVGVLQAGNEILLQVLGVLDRFLDGGARLKDVLQFGRQGSGRREARGEVYDEPGERLDPRPVETVDVDRMNRAVGGRARADLLRRAWPWGRPASPGR